MKAKWQSSVCAAAVIGVIAVAPMLATAQQGASTGADGRPARGLEEIVVTGTKRAGAQQDTPIAISTVTEEMLDRTFLTDITALSGLAPNVTLEQVAGFRALAGGIRGTGANQILVTSTTSTAVLVDEFGLSSVQSQFVDMFDVEQIEVYRGPQGTLFGKNATGGAIVITTKRPEFNEFFGSAQAQVGRYDVNGGSINKIRGALNIPMIDDMLAARVSLIYDREDGYYRNGKPASSFPDVVPFYANFGIDPVNPPFPPGLDTTAQGSGERLGGIDVFAGKVKLLFKPTENYEAYFMYEGLRDRSDSPPVVNESPALGEFDPTGGTYRQGADQFMILPLLGFDGVGTQGFSDKEKLNTAITNRCIGRNPKGICTPEGHRVNVDGFHLHQTLDLDTMSFKMISGYREMKELLPSTYTGEYFGTLFDATRNTKREQLQLELRAVSDFDGRFNFLAGAVYAEDHLDYVAYSVPGFVGLISLLPSQDPNHPDPLVAGGVLTPDGFLNLNLDANNDPTPTAVGQERDSYAFYFDGYFDITDDLRLTAGVRYTNEKVTFSRRNNPGGACTESTPLRDIVPADPSQPRSIDNCLFDARSNALSRAELSLAEIDPFELPLPDSAFDLVLDGESSRWDEITYRVVLDYSINDHTMVYAGYATGFLSGGYTEQCSSVVTCRPYDPETNENFEVGLKSDLFDRTLRLNIALFETRFEDLIRAQSVPFTNRAGVTTQEVINVNAGKSRARGFEVEATWLPTDQLRIDLSVGYLDHKYRDFVLDLDGDGVLDPVLEDVSRLTVPFSGNWQVSAGASYEFDLAAAGSLVLNTSANYRSEVETLVFNSLYTQLEKRLLWDASATWRDRGERYEVSAYVKNITNEIYRSAGNSVGGLWAYTMYGRPREYGLRLGVHF
ncbi:MAG: TonB-dependent receptor [Gammaproteobacteria bacterium]|nr:TonB-dependent receptor [Gammaproteobacteria bacterium]